MMFLSTLSTMLTGFIMSIIRIREPYMKFLIKQWFVGIFGETVSDGDEQDSKKSVNDSLATFLTSSLNVELVHVILDSITKHTKSYTDPNRNYLSFTDNKFKEKHTFIIDTIKIKDADKWKVANAKLDEFIVSDHEHCNNKRKTTKNVLGKSNAPLLTNQQDAKIPVQLHCNDHSDTDLIINEDVTVTEYASDCFGFLRQIDKIDF